MRYLTFEAAPQTPEELKARDIFEQLATSARASGNAEMLMRLDRVPMLLLGTRGSERPEERAKALSVAYAELQLILSDLESSGGDEAGGEGQSAAGSRAAGH